MTVVELRPARAVEPAHWAGSTLRGYRFPLAPLEAARGRRAGELAAIVGVSENMVAQARRRGLNERQADEWAVACGLHPGTVWPEWWWTAPSEVVVDPGQCCGPRGSTGTVRPTSRGRWRVQVYAGGGRYLGTSRATRASAEEARLQLLERAAALRS